MSNMDILHTPGFEPAFSVAWGCVNWWMFIGTIVGSIMGAFVFIYALIVPQGAGEIGAVFFVIMAPVIGMVLGPLSLVFIVWFIVEGVKAERRKNKYAR